MESVKAYREAMAEFAAMRTLDVWYAHMSEHDIQEAMQAVQEEASATAKSGKGKSGKGKSGKKHAKATKAGNAEDSQVAKAIKTANKTLRKAHTRDSLHALTRFAEVVDGRYRIVSEPPVVVPLRELDGAWGLSADQIRGVVEDQFRAYQSSLSADRRLLLERFSIVDMARKVVGVGSVGTRAWMVLLRGPRQRRPAVPAGQGGHPVGPGGPSAEEPFPHPGTAGGGGATADAGRLRHLPGLDQGGAGRPLLLLAPAARHEGVRGGRDHDTVRDDVLRPDVRVDARPRARPIG